MTGLKRWRNDFGFTLTNVGGGEAQLILKALRLHRGDEVLDAPYGAGRVSCHLAQAGCVVSGIGLREAFLRRARQRFRAAGMHGTFRVLDLRQLDLEVSSMEFLVGPAASATFRKRKMPGSLPPMSGPCVRSDVC